MNPRFRQWVTALGLAVAATPVTAGEIAVLALSEGKAILRVDGVRRVLSVGESSPEGVRLLHADTGEAEVLWQGRRLTLPLQAVISPIVDAPDGPRVVLLADRQGFFHADGRINGHAVRFLVDTGATSVALNAALARRLGLDYRKGRRGLAHTAGGVVPVYHVTLDRVSVGGIVVHQVAAGVIEGAQPDPPLLGMSFLSQVQMLREGYRMELLQK